MYEIPQQLEYKEKIVFGLTFGQLMWALMFFPFAFVFFFRLKASLSVRICLTLIPLSLASGFMFFNFASYIKDWKNWHKFREIKTKESLEKTFIFKEVSDNLIHTR